MTGNWGACLCLVTIFSLLCSLTRADLFPLPEFTGKDVTTSVFGSDSDEIFPVAFGDLDADKFTDVVTVTKDKSSLVVLFSKQETPYLQRGVHCNIRTNKNFTVEIVGVAPGDFNGDGLMDLAVTIEQHGTEEKELIILKGEGNDVICDAGAEKVSSKLVQEPLAADLNGDMIVDLVGEEYEHESESSNGKGKILRKIWIFPQAQSYPFIVIDGKNVRKDDFREMANPSSSAFVDIDADYVPELILVTKTSDKDIAENRRSRSINYWIETYKVNLNPNALMDEPPVTFSMKRNPIPVVKENNNAIGTVGQPLFIDLNQSGELVYILPYCDKECCQADTGSGLVAIVNGSTVDIPIQGKDYNGKLWKWKYAKNKCEKDSSNSYVRSHFDGYYSRTISLRVGDYNLDGYPDLIGVVVSEKENDQHKEERAVVLENVPCKVSEKVKCPFPRTFNLRFDVLQDYQNVTLATFYDIHDDGLIDVFLVRRTLNDKNKPKYEVHAFENSPDYDSNFFKVMVLSGRPCSRCPQNGIPYGNVVTGPIIKYRTTTQIGERQTAVAAQNYRSSHLSMDLPYTIFGIGHSPNFVETLIVGVSPSDKENRTHEWPQIIPNSQIIVIPPQLGSQDIWKFKLFLTPSDAMWKTFAVLIGVILVVLLIVCGLYYKERKEDKMDRLQEAHRFMM